MSGYMCIVYVVGWSLKQIDHLLIYFTLNMTKILYLSIDCYIVVTTEIQATMQNWIVITGLAVFTSKIDCISLHQFVLFCP